VRANFSMANAAWVSCRQRSEAISAWLTLQIHSCSHPTPPRSSLGHLLARSRGQTWAAWVVGTFPGAHLQLQTLLRHTCRPHCQHCVPVKVGCVGGHFAQQYTPRMNDPNLFWSMCWRQDLARNSFNGAFSTARACLLCSSTCQLCNRCPRSSAGSNSANVAFCRCAAQCSRWHEVAACSLQGMQMTQLLH